MTDVVNAAVCLKAGGVIAHATEGVWGLACDPFNRKAVDRILTIKGREAAKGMLLIGASSDTFDNALAAMEPDLRARVDHRVAVAAVLEYPRRLRLDGDERRRHRRHHRRHVPRLVRDVPPRQRDGLTNHERESRRLRRRVRANEPVGDSGARGGAFLLREERPVRLRG